MTDSITAEKLAGLSKLLDRQAILDCLTQISRGADRFDRELYVSGFHSDALIDAGAYVGTPSEIYDGPRKSHEHGQLSTLHSILNHSCDLNGELAHAETYWFFHGLNRDKTNWLAGGRYLDRFEKRDGSWKIAFRYTILEWSSVIPAGTVALFENVPDLRLNGIPARGKDDASYRRPLTNVRQVRSHGDLSGPSA